MVVSVIECINVTQLSAYVCGNGNQPSPAAPPAPKSEDHDGDPFVPSTGNDAREVKDLQLFAGAGDHKLAFIRYSNSRYSSGVSYFGSGSNFRHSYQWEAIFTPAHQILQSVSLNPHHRRARLCSATSSSTDSGGSIPPPPVYVSVPATMTIYYPDGNMWTFTQSSSNPNQYLSTAACSDRLFVNGSTFVLQRDNGYQYYFLPFGSGYQMAYFQDAHGTQYSLNYDNLGRVTKVNEPAGRALWINYSGSVISSVQSNDGRTITFNYSNFNDPVSGIIYPTLTSVVYPDGSQAQYTYTQPVPQTRPVLASASDPHYKLPFTKIGLTYQTNVTSVIGQIASQVDLSSGCVIDNLGQISSNNTTCPMVTEPAAGNAQRSFWMTEATGQVQWKSDGLGNRIYLTYDQSGYGFINSTTDANGHTTSMANSAYGNLLARTNPDSSVENWTRDAQDRVLSYQDPLGHTTSYTRDGSGRVTTVQRPDGTSEGYTYNSFNQVVTHTLPSGAVENRSYNSRGLLTTSSDALGNATSYGYDSADRVNSITDPLGNTTQMTYNDRGQMTKMTHPDGTSVSYGYDDFGNLTNTVDETGAISSKSCDSYHQVTSSTDPLGNTTTYGYYAIYHNLPNLVTLPSGKQMQIGYDTAFHVTNKTVGAGTSDAATTTYTYDKVGNVTAMVDGNGNQWIYAYDNRNRKIAQTDPQGNKTQYAYDAAGNLVSLTRPDGKVLTSTYDAMNRLVTSTDALGNTTSYTYDVSGNMLSLTDAKGNVYSYTYDALNRRLSMSYPDGSKELWSYDAAGNLATYTTRANQVCTYTYDSRNRNIGYSWSDGTPGAIKTYDGVGRLLSQSNSQGGVSYGYDAMGRKTSETQTIITGSNSVTHTISYAYDVDGNLVSTTYPNGSVITKSFTGRNQVASIAADGPPPLAIYSYDAAGNRVGNALENGVTVSYSYDKARRLTGITNALAGSTNPIAGYQYSLNKLSLRTHIQETTPLFNRGYNFSYDLDNQLTNAYYGGGSTLGTLVYNYDALGNRISTSKGTTNTVIPYLVNNLNEYTQIGSLLVSYDKNGNMTSTTNGATFGYDAKNRLVSARSGTNTMSVSYDIMNRVVSRVINGSTNYYAYDGWKLIEVYNGSGAEQARYVYGTGSDEPLCMITPTGTYYYHQDGNGNVTAMTDSHGAIVESYSYDPFGNVTIYAPNGTVRGASAVGNRFMFAGREYIAQLGLYDYRNRVYSPVYGRFLQTDPIRFQGGDYNIYRYCGNNPINGTDPLGLCNQQSQPVYIAPPDQANNVLGGDLSSNQASDPEGQGAADAAGSELAAAAILAAALGPAGMEAAGMDAAAAEASPVLNPANLAGRTATEIDAAAQDAGLIPKGPSPITGEGAYVDPVTGEQRVLIHPDSDTPHMHVNDPSGARLDINGNTVSPESPAAHLPLGVH